MREDSPPFPERIIDATVLVGGSFPGHTFCNCISRPSAAH
jgi:hypothetical protein